MSWQDYVDKQLLASGFVNHAAIIGSDGALWAKSASFDVSITRTLCHFIFVSFRFLHFDSSFVSFYGILILLSLCVLNAPKNVSDRRDCFPYRFLFSLVMSFSLSFKTTDLGTRHAAIYGHEFGRIFKYGVALSLSSCRHRVNRFANSTVNFTMWNTRGDTPRSPPPPTLPLLVCLALFLIIAVKPLFLFFSTSGVEVLIYMSRYQEISLEL